MLRTDSVQPSMSSDTPWVCITLALAIVFGLRYAMRNRGQKSLQDPYGSFHIALNAHPKRSESSNVEGADKSSTEWLNMGYWEHTDSFPEACEALALRLIASADCKQGGRVLDVGHGSGDSLLLHLQHPRVPRPSLLVGITSLSAHHQQSTLRVHECQTRSATASDIKVELLVGDAVHRLGISSSRHPLSSNGGQFTTIIALDCAYHFRTRHTFLEQCFTHLSPGGRIALADICFANKCPPSQILRGILGLLGLMPSPNAITQHQYLRSMSDIGYEDVSVEDISAHVFPGFMRFLWNRGFGWKAFVSVFNAMLVRRGASFVIVTGRKPSPSSSRATPSL